MIRNPLEWLRAVQYPCRDCPRHDGLTAHDIAVAAALTRWAGVSSCTARSTVQQLADTARCDRRTVMRSTAKLRERGWLIVRRSTTGKYGKGVNLYALTIPEPVDEPVDNRSDRRGGWCHTVTYLGDSQTPTHAQVGDSVTHAVGTRELEGGSHTAAAIAELLTGKAL